MFSGMAAKKQWEAATFRCDRCRVKRGRSSVELFRQYHGAFALIEWHGALGVIKKVEAGPEPGSAGELVTFLKTVADNHGASLIGNVSAYATANRPVADQERAVAFYEGHGFQVSGFPDYAIRYPAPAED